MSTVRKMAYNAGYVVGGRLASMIVTFLVGIYLVRYLGSSELGRYSTVLAYLFFFQVLAGLGIGSILVREMARDPDQTGRLIGSGALLTLLLSVIAVLVSWLGLLFVGYPSDMKTYAIIASLVMLFSVTGVFKTVFQAQLIMKFAVAVDMGRQLFSSVLLLALILIRAPLLYFFVAAVITEVPPLLASLFLCRRHHRLEFKVDLKLWKWLLAQSWPLALTSLFISIYVRVDQVMLFSMKGDQAVGYYSAAVRLSEFFGIIPTAFITAVFPLLASTSVTSPESFQKIYRLSFKYLDMASVPICMGIFLLAEPITVLLFGRDYLSSAGGIRALIWSEVFVFMGAVNMNLLIAIGRQRLDMMFTSASLVVNIVLNLLLIPRFSFVGAALASTIAYGVGPVMALFIPATRPFSVSMFRYIVKPMVAALVMAVLIHFVVGESLALAIPIGVVIYSAVMFAIKGIDGYDVSLVKSLVLRRKPAQEALAASDQR